MSLDFNAITLSERSAWELGLEASSASELTSYTKSGSASAQINQGALLSFDAALSKQMTEDVSNSLLFAQLAADKQFNRLTSTGNWEKTFFSVLSVVGWIVGNFTKKSLVTASPVDWVKLVASTMPENAARLVDSSVTACQTLPETSKAITIWSSAALQKDSGLLIVLPSYIVGDSPATSVSLIEFTFERESTGFLKWNLDYNVATMSATLELNEGVYSNVRQTIIEKLGNRPKYLVANVPMD
ncbi:hypothetical protein Rleg10DRAFT_0057 [Rhizobium leguminosarum bv. trifolii WSM2012]|nr:hypothetical protein Rleg10DRAFT_0057 [Rhizobium leguminosarum bv. trifolii WSM2012]